MESKDKTGGQATQDTQDPAPAAAASGGDGISAATGTLPEDTVQDVETITARMKLLYKGSVKDKDNRIDKASIVATWKYLIKEDFVSNADKLKNQLMMNPIPKELEFFANELETGIDLEEDEADRLVKIIIGVINKEPFIINQEGDVERNVRKVKRGKKGTKLVVNE